VPAQTYQCRLISPARCLLSNLFLGERGGGGGGGVVVYTHALALDAHGSLRNEGGEVCQRIEFDVPFDIGEAR
jgi:hypothetical protein